MLPPPLKPVHAQRLAGLIFVCVADEPPSDFDDMAQRMLPYLAPHALTHTKVARQVDIIEHGNWKLTIENNRECFHCAGHPELLRSLFDFFGEVDEKRLSAQEQANYCRYLGARGESEALWRRFGLPWEPIEELFGRATGFRTERLVLDGHGESMTPDTRAASRRLLGQFTEPRLGSLHYHVQPNAWFHFLSDHVLTFATLPLSRERTLVRSTWLVDADAEPRDSAAAPGDCARRSARGVRCSMKSSGNGLPRPSTASFQRSSWPVGVRREPSVGPLTSTPRPCMARTSAARSSLWRIT